VTLKSGFRCRSRLFKLVPFENLGAVCYSPSIVTSFPRYSQILGNNRDFLYLLHSTPTLGGSPSEYCHPVWYGKPRMAGLLDGEKNVRISACDRQTDKRTDIVPRHSPRYADASGGENC